MANKNQQETRTSIDDLNDSLSSIEQKVEGNQKLISWILIAVAAVTVLVIVYIFLIREPAIKAADEAVSQADITLIQGNDSLALAQYKQVADEYGYEAGNRAALQTAILYYKKKDYKQALEYVKKYDQKETVVGAASLALEGDCYVNLGQLDDALAAFKKAVKASDNNPLYTPLFLIKEANVLRAQNKTEEELKVYETIQEEYPEFGPAYNYDIQKYIERCKAQLGQD
ncbi:MAG: tetratricopeptide repeat protein [Muribaculaceae bacterium]